MHRWEVDGERVGANLFDVRRGGVEGHAAGRGRSLVPHRHGAEKAKNRRSTNPYLTSRYRVRPTPNVIPPPRVLGVPAVSGDVPAKGEVWLDGGDPLIVRKVDHRAQAALVEYPDGHREWRAYPESLKPLPHRGGAS